MEQTEYSSNAACVYFSPLVFLQNRMAERYSLLCPLNTERDHARPPQEHRILQLQYLSLILQDL